MWLDNTEYWTLWIILYCGLASSHGVRSGCDGCVREEARRARPNAPVLLPCAIPPNATGSAAGGDRAKVLWTQFPRSTLLEITQTGRVNFSDPRGGRVKVFPNLCREGNFSIFIEHLQPSDVGKYCCELRNYSICSVVEFSTNNADEQNEGVHFMEKKGFVIGGGAGGVFFVLLILCCCCVKFRNRDDSVPDATRSSSHKGSDAGDVGDAEDAGEIVYENDAHDPNSIPHEESKHQQEISSSSSTGQQPRAGRPFYANQKEIDKQLEKRKKVHKQNFERFQYENPIYANSVEHLDQV
ncbi:uncharacterized protein LOC135236423 isoform X1 [Anguilla rostrata]|uniref:uncharacterized protein LOC135236423 isoform X1 n=1 Tax=Anguilla rostrata TaxID=7938 RepID=UPI0030CFC782